MSFPAYPHYQGSGVDWLGDVPSHWQVRRLGGLFTERRDKVSDTDFPALSVTKQGIVPQLETAAKTDDNDNRKGVRAGDFVINSRSDRKGSSGLSQLDGSVSLINTVITPDSLLDPTFVHFLLRSVAFQEEFYRYGKGIVADLWSTNYSEMKNILLAFPERPEQAVIAAFLDRETAKIDALVEEQRRLIALLKEKRQAVISHAVTNGLDPHAPMKDSGIEWLGKVPEHWTVRPIKTVVDGVEQGWSPQCDAGPVESSEQWGVLKVGCVNGGLFNPNENKALPPDLEPRPEIAVRAGDVLISRANTRELVGSAAVVERDHDRLLLCDKLYRLSVSPAQIIPEYLASYLQSDVARGQIEVAASGASSSMLNIGQSVIREMPIPTPPLAEQRRIVAHLQRNRSMSDALIFEAQSAIALLVERRAALISAAVSGKIDVRGSAKVLPFPIDRARARGLVATEIIERLAGRPTFGRVKFQKVAFLAEGHVGISELEGSYLREAAGPLDRTLRGEMERGAINLAGVVVDQSGGTGKTVVYRLTGQRGAHRQELADWLGPDRTAKLDKLITNLADLDKKGAEAVATLYGVWNDMLSEGASPSDDEIISGFLNDWHDEKREKFRASELPEWLGWMRRHGIVPNGSGPKSARQIGALL